MTGWFRKSVSLVLTWFLVTLPIQAPAQDKPIQSHCNALLSGLGRGSHGDDYYDDWVFHNAPKEAATVVSTVLPNTVATFIVSPTNEEEYHKIFKPDSPTSNQTENLTQTQASELRSVKASLKDTLGRDRPDDLSGNSVAARIRAAPASFVIVVGHNDKGDFRFPDGTSTTIDSMAQAARPDQRLIFISCRAAEYLTQPNSAGARRELTYPEAFRIAKSIENQIAAIPVGLSIDGVKQRLESTEASIGVQYQVTYFLMKAACALGAAIVVALFISLADPCLHKDKC